MVFGGFKYRNISGHESVAQLIISAMPIYAAACLAYFIAIFLSPKQIKPGLCLIFIIIIGLAVRSTMFFSPAILGADHCRYRWDGAVTAAGADPYRYSPQELLADTDTTDPDMQALIQKGRPILENINHPQYRTIYPPVAQLLFAAGHKIAPFKITGWRTVLLIFDVLAAIFVALLLRAAGRSMSYLAVYLWNPLLVVETYFGSHVDLAAVALVLGVIYLLIRGHVVIASAGLALAAGIKLWPALLIFIVLVPVMRNRRQMLTAALTFAGVLLLTAIPYRSAFVPGDNSGLLAYSHYWFFNGGAFVFFQVVGDNLAGIFEIQTREHLIGRTLLTLTLIIIAILIARKAKHDPVDLCSRIGTLTLLMLLLSPTVFPWYYLAVMPMAALAMRPALLAWTLLLPLSYFILYGVNDWIISISAIIHAPVWLLLIVERIKLLPFPKRYCRFLAPLLTKEGPGEVNKE